MATSIISAADLHVNDRVLATEALRGVPVGTGGKVIHVQGLTWTRYWVWFDNGERVGTIGRTKLATPAEWDQRHAVGAEAPVATRAVAVAAVGAAEGGDAKPVDALAALLEKSRLAKERKLAALAAKKDD